MKTAPTLPTAAALCAIFAVAACDPGPQAPVASTNATANAAAPEAKPSPKAVAAFPETYLGKWGLMPEDCKGSAGGGRMTVTGTKLSFAGSSATASEIMAVGPEVVTATLAYKNAKGAWSSPTTMMLQDDGKTLVRDDTHPAGRFRYTRCPA